MNFLPIVLLCCVSLTTTLSRGASGYFVKPTQPANSSCPGQPCLTLAQYINASDFYFKSNNNSVFWLLNGTHFITSPLNITDAFNVTIKSYPWQDNHYNKPLIVYNSSNFCECPFGTGVCQKCSAIQFYNARRATVEGIELVSVKFNATSSITGIYFTKCDIIRVQSVSVSVNSKSVENNCVNRNGFSYVPILCGGIILEGTTETLLLNLTLKYVGFEAFHSHGFVVQNLTAVSSCRHGINTKYTTNISIQNVVVSGSKGHSLCFEQTQNMSVSGGRLSNSSDNGIYIENSSDIILNSIQFYKMKIKAIHLFQTRNTNVTNSKMNVCFLFCVYIQCASNTLFHNVTVMERGIWGQNIWGTSFINLNMTSLNTGLLLLNASHTVIEQSYLTVAQGSINALFINNSKETVIKNVTTNTPLSIQNSCNTLFDGSHMWNVINQPALMVYGGINTTIQHMSFKEFNGSFTDITNHPAVVVLYQTGNVNFHHCTFTGNEVSAVKAVGSDLTFSGTVMFVNNTASLGAAVILQQKSVMTLAQNSSLLFINNHAISVGGAIYVDTNTFYEVDEEGNAEHITLHAVCSFQFKGESFEFHNNCAGSGGDVVYGGHMGLATTATGSNCLQQFKQFSVINQTNTMSVISSQPSRVCVCNSTGYPDCLRVFYTHTVYPGESISLQAVVVGQDFGTGAGSIYGQFLSSGVEERAKLEPWQYSQEVSQTHCNQLTYSILAAPTRSIDLVLTAVEMGEVQIVSNTTVNSTLKEYHKFQNGDGLFPQELLDFPVYINIIVRPCPVGFSLSESSHKCVCNPTLSELPGVNCYIENQTFERSGTSWIGLNDETEIVVSQYCRMVFCDETAQNITVGNLDLQCNYNRSGVLCGRCRKGLSVPLGTHRCLRCSNRYLSLLLPFALAGFVVVFAIKILDVTVSTGYINGLILYFNIIQCAWAIFRAQGHNNALAVIVSWVNLDLGIETCFFDGLTQYWKTWLQFLFPLYIWTISGAVIILARYSSRMATMMGSNPVSVLATLFLLSYTKLLRVCIAIISLTYVEYPNGTKMVWLFNGNIEYLGAEHLPLFVVAVVVLIVLCVPYTLILLLGQWLNKCTNEVISRVMFRIKPIMDAYYGPLKDNHRYWIGVLLLSRAIIHIVLALNPDRTGRAIWLAIAVLSIFLLQMIGYVKGFYQSWCVSAYEVTIISNLALYTLAKLYSEGTESFTLDNIFVGAATLQMCCLIIYRLYIISKRQISRILTTPWKRNHVRRGNVVCKKREANEEETLVKKSSEAMDDGNNEEIPISTYSLPTYGT